MNALFAAFLAAVIAVTLCMPASAFAADFKAGSMKTTEAETAATTTQHELTTCAKVKKVKKSGFTTSTPAINKKATKVKRGTNKLLVKGSTGYVKLVAPKTKTYSFTFSGVKGTDGRGSSAYATAMTPDSYYPHLSFSTNTKMKTYGGKTNTLWLAYQGRTFNYYSSKVSQPIAKRTGKIKLTKGQVFYFYFSGTAANTYTTLKIK